MEEEDVEERPRAGLCFAPVLPPLLRRGAAGNHEPHARTPSRLLHLLPLPLLALPRPASRSGGSRPRIDGVETDSAAVILDLVAASLE
jgi:hypothetical protein